MSFRTLLVSHLVVFGAGVYVGKALDAGELATYREAYESPWAKMRRKMGAVALGTVAVGSLIVVVRVAVNSRARVETV